MESEIRTAPKSPAYMKKYLTYGLLFIALLLLILRGALIAGGKAPAAFPQDYDIVIEEGLTHAAIAEKLEEEQVVRSAFLFHITLILHFENKFVQAGTYQFPKALSTYEVANALTEGAYKSPTLTLMLPEGFSVRDFYKLLPQGYDVPFEKDLSDHEGRLFPDTYFIGSDMALDDLLHMLEETMVEKLEPYTDMIAGSPFTEDEVLILASILEREANDPESMRIVSGILQNRLDIGMALQVDATLDYLLDKTSAELTQDDLEIDSPFNTYAYPGLPPRPISNPGLASIEAVLNPEETSYLYYLTGKDGEFYYAKTFEEHKRNKERYLR